jgi:hypothetical protein
MIQVTFWKSDFIGANLEQLVAILKQDALKGVGSWFILKTNFIQAFIEEDQYKFIMQNVANYGDPELNK